MKKILFCISLFIISLLVSCAGGAGGSASSSETGRLAFSSARALGSGASEKSDLQNFTLKGSRNGGTQKTLKTWSSYESFKGSVVELDVGTWTFTLEAEYPSGKTYIYGGSKTAEIKADEDTVVLFVLKAKGFLPSEAGFSDCMLSNGYACENGEQGSINSASSVGVVFKAEGGSVVVVNTALIHDGSGQSVANMIEWANSVGDGWRLPTVAELNLIHEKMILGSVSGVSLPNTGYILSSEVWASHYQMRYVADTAVYTGSSTGGCAVCAPTSSPSGAFWGIVVKEF